jgi:hypothetical protein
VPSGGVPSGDRGYVFGLDVASSVALPIARSNGANGLPKVTVREVSSEELAKHWQPAAATAIAHWRTPTGRRTMSIDSDPELGYRIAAPSQGSFVVSSEGREIVASLPNVQPWRWQRLLFSQVLPLAAALRGLSPFHASAVAIDGRGLAFVAASGAGKTSVAAHLITRGASFVTDDVLALGSSASGVVVHPGPGVARLRARELAAIRKTGDATFGQIIGRSDKIQLAIRPLDRAVSLDAVYFLERSPRFDRLEIAESRYPDPSQVLSSSFVTYVSTPKFQLAHLDVCSQIVQTVRMFDVLVPESSLAVETARLIASHAGA